MYVLTKEGMKYLNEKLPEINLIEAVKKGPIHIKLIDENLQNSKIAIMWAKENGWIFIDEGNIHFKTAPKSYDQQEGLEKIHRGEEVDNDIIKVLLRRKLVEMKRENLRKKAESHTGKKLNKIPTEIIKTGNWDKVKLSEYNVESIGKKMHIGKRHPYSSILTEIRQKLLNNGFIEITGNSIELEFWNFDALYQPQNHPSRDWTDTYRLKHPKKGRLPKNKIVENVRKTHETGWNTGSTGWKYKWSSEKASNLMPIAHDTALSPKILSSDEIKIPGKYFQIVRCYRPDVIDSTHGVEFNQLGGFIIDKNLTFKNLLGTLKKFSEFMGVKETKFYPDYYPFTEPSVQISGKHPKLGWIEFAGAGFFRDELTKPLGIDYPVIAWGFGIDRLAMHKLNINDIRELFTRNLEFLRKSKMVDA